MSEEDLKVTCERLERSCEDMRSLLNEFVEEQAMLRREQDRLHKRVEKAQKKVGRSQENFIDNLISDMEHLEVLSCKNRVSFADDFTFTHEGSMGRVCLPT
eukprot:symbB.v1.2.016695.t1/scaffold1262.1/size136238/4